MQKSIVNLPSQRVSLFIREEGKGFPLLLMHGGPGADHTTLLSLLPLSKNYRLIFYDHRCNGRSSKPDVSTMTWANLAADAEAIRKHFGIEEWAVIGQSFGGMVALEYATRFPKSISHLVLLDTGGDGSWVQKRAPNALLQRGFSKLAVAMAERFYSGRIRRSELKKVMAILGSAYYSNPSIAFLLKQAVLALKIRANVDAFIFGFKELITGWSVMDRLGRIASPTLIVSGWDDFQFPPEHQKELEKGIAGAKLYLLAGAGHNAHVEQTEKVIKLIGDFIKVP